MNYFSLFNLPIYYQIDIQKLASRFHDLQRQYHPDKFIKTSQKDLLVATQQSAIINRAWKTLRDPLNRAEYLLSLYGFNIDNKEHIVHDVSFLMEQFSSREELNEIEKTQDEMRLKIFIKQKKEIFDSLYQQMIMELNNKAWKNAVNIVRKLRFIDKLRNLAEQLEERLFKL